MGGDGTRGLRRENGVYEQNTRAIPLRSGMALSLLRAGVRELDYGVVWITIDDLQAL